MTAWKKVKQLLASIAWQLSRLPWKSGVALGLLAGASYLGTLYDQTRHTVFINVNGVEVIHQTRRRAATDVLHELGIEMMPSDTWQLPNDDDFLAGEPAMLTIARRVQIAHDGRTTEVCTHAMRLSDVMAEAGLTLGAGDELWSDGGRLAPDAALSELARPRRLSLAAWVSQIRWPVRLSIRRAVTFTISDDYKMVSLTTTADTVGAALSQASVAVYEGDRVVPSLDTPIVSDLAVQVERSRGVTIEVDGRAYHTRTRAESVADLLVEARVQLEDEDRIMPAQETPISDGLQVSITRVYDEYYVEEVPIPYETRWQGNTDLEIDQKRTASWGREGAMRQQVRVHYENGVEVSREEGEPWVAREPEDRILEYGTGIVVRQLDTPSGTIEYWRRVRMLATSYNAATAGVSTSSPTYGITRLGEPARKGVIAVDPTLIPLRQPMYVPGYGVGFAGDTGGAIKNRRIDLCYDDDNLVMWYRWVDVYLLTPVPPAHLITWIVPNAPVERE